MYFEIKMNGKTNTLNKLIYLYIVNGENLLIKMNVLK